MPIHKTRHRNPASLEPGTELSVVGMITIYPWYGFGRPKPPFMLSSHAKRHLLDRHPRSIAFGTHSRCQKAGPDAAGASSGRYPRVTAKKPVRLLPLAGIPSGRIALPILTQV
jgi:hypothetical protein